MSPDLLFTPEDGRVPVNTVKKALKYIEERATHISLEGRHGFLVLRFKSGFTSLTLKLKKDFMNTLKGEDPSRMKIFTEASSTEDKLKALIKVF